MTQMEYEHKANIAEYGERYLLSWYGIEQSIKVFWIKLKERMKCIN